MGPSDTDPTVNERSEAFASIQPADPVETHGNHVLYRCSDRPTQAWIIGPADDSPMPAFRGLERLSDWNVADWTFGAVAVWHLTKTS